MIEHNLIFTLDSYKDLHDQMLEPNTEGIFDYYESRIGAEYAFTILFGLQVQARKWLTGVVVTKELIDEAEPILKEHFKYSGDVWSRNKWDYIVEKHNGKLPIRIRAVPEGLKIPINNILIGVEETDPKCAWLVGALETVLQQVWYASVVATRSNIIVGDIKDFFKKTVDDDLFWLSDFYLHDFGMRACTCMEQAGLGGMAHLINSKGTDTKMGIPYAINYYGADYKDLCYSVPASEHSIQTALGEDREFEVTKRLIKQFPNGILSIVSDSYNIERAIKYYCDELKSDIMGRNGKFVVRPDSPRFEGDTPAKQILWIVKELWNGFGGSVNSKGYKVLDSHIGGIYGDSLTREQIREALQLLMDNGFSAQNFVYGCGGYLLQKLNRDTQRSAFKSSAQKRDGVWHDVYKSPSDKSKSSKRGRLELVKRDGEIKTVRLEEVLPTDELMLVTIFENGKMVKEYTFNEVKANAGTN